MAERFKNISSNIPNMRDTVDDINNHVGNMSHTIRGRITGLTGTNKILEPSSTAAITIPKNCIIDGGYLSVNSAFTTLSGIITIGTDTSSNTDNILDSSAGLISAVGITGAVTAFTAVMTAPLYKTSAEINPTYTLTAANSVDADVVIKVTQI